MPLSSIFCAFAVELVVLSTSDVDRGQTPEDEAEDEDKTPRTRTRPMTKPRGRGRGQNHEAEDKAEDNFF